MLVTISHRLRNQTYISKTIAVTDAPRPPGVVTINSHSIWTRRFVREYFGVGAHPPGEWIPRTGCHAITASRRKLVARFVAKEQP